MNAYLDNSFLLSGIKYKQIVNIHIDLVPDFIRNYCTITYL